MTETRTLQKAIDEVTTDDEHGGRHDGIRVAGRDGMRHAASSVEPGSGASDEAQRLL